MSNIQILLVVIGGGFVASFCLIWGCSELLIEIVKRKVKPFNTKMTERGIGVIGAVVLALWIIFAVVFIRVQTREDVSVYDSRGIEQEWKEGSSGAAVYMLTKNVPFALLSRKDRRFVDKYYFYGHTVRPRVQDTIYWKKEVSVDKYYKSDLPVRRD